MVGKARGESAVCMCVWRKYTSLVREITQICCGREAVRVDKPCNSKEYSGDGLGIAVTLRREREKKRENCPSQSLPGV